MLPFASSSCMAPFPSTSSASQSHLASVPTAHTALGAAGWREREGCQEKGTAKIDSLRAASPLHHCQVHIKRTLHSSTFPALSPWHRSGLRSSPAAGSHTPCSQDIIQQLRNTQFGMPQPPESYSSTLWAEQPWVIIPWLPKTLGVLGLVLSLQSQAG